MAEPTSWSRPSSLSTSLCHTQSLISPPVSPSLLHLLPVAHLRLMILSSDCSNYPSPAAAMHYAQHTHKAEEGEGGGWGGQIAVHWPLDTRCETFTWSLVKDRCWEFSPPADDWCVKMEMLMTPRDALLFSGWSLMQMKPPPASIWRSETFVADMCQADVWSTVVSV